MDIKSLISQIKLTDDFFKRKLARTIDRYLTIRNWLVGCYIVEYEQNGLDRAEYGAKLLQNIADKLDTKGLSQTNLKLFKQFYLIYPQIGQTLSDLLSLETSQTASDLLKNNIGQTLSDQTLQKRSPGSTINQTIAPYQLISNLSFSHIVELMKIEESLKRNFYEIEAIKGVWSVRELKRQISTLNFERSAVSKEKPFNELGSVLLLVNAFGCKKGFDKATNELENENISFGIVV